jgi:hypothetical protein
MIMLGNVFRINFYISSQNTKYVSENIYKYLQNSTGNSFRGYFYQRLLKKFPPG